MIGTLEERAVIGAILLDYRAHRFAADVLRPEEFSALQFEQMFAGITGMLARGEHVDAITVGAKLAEWEVRGVEPWELHELTSAVPHVGGVGAYAAQVHDAAVRRAILIAGQRALTAASSSTPSGEILARTIAEFQEVQKGAVSRDLEAKPLVEVLSGVDDYDWVVEGLLERRDRLVLTGGEGAGKSTFVRQLAILSAAGVHPTTFGPIEPVRVLVVDAENSEKQWRRAARGVVERARRAGAVDPSHAVHLACAPRLDLTRDAHLGQVHRLIDRYTPDVLFIGPLYRLTPRAITNDDDAAPLLAALDTLRDRGVALVMEAHAGHAVGIGGERDLRPRGSAALMGWPEFGMGIRASREDPSGQLFDVVRWRGDRDERAWPKQMQRGMGWPWTPTF